MSEITKYELMVAANAKSGEALAARIDKVFKESEVVNIKVEKMGKRMLAYPILKQNEAEFFVYNFEAPGEAISKISTMLRLEQDAVLRYLIVKTRKTRNKVSKVSPIRQAQGGQGAKVAEVSKVDGEGEKTKAKVIIKATSKVVKTKIVAKKVEKVVKKRRGKTKGKKGIKS